MTNINLKFFLTCDKAIVDRDSGMLSIINVFDRISSPVFPTNHSLFHVVGRIDNEVGKHRLILKFLGPNQAEITKPYDKEIEIEKDKPLQFNIRVDNLHLDSIGKYVLQLFLDKSLLGETSILAEQR